MDASQSLPVIVPRMEGQSWSCHSCGDCCRSLVGELSDEERRQIDEQGWAEKLDVAPYVRLGDGWALNKRADNACVFLDEQDRCRIHSEFGEESKPFACRIFPFSVRPVENGWQSSLRFDCPSVISSRGEPVRANRLWLQFLLKERLHEAPHQQRTVELQRGIQATDQEIDCVIKAYTAWIRNDEITFDRRLLGAAFVTTTLANANFKKIRGERFAELVELLFAALPTECEGNPQPPSNRQQGMLRQLAFAHVEHVSLEQRQAGYLRRLNMRRHQLTRSKRLRKGRGEVPPIAGVVGPVLFDELESVLPAQNARQATEDLLKRYLAARLESHSVFGPGYYGWPVFSGFAALWASLAVVGWLARYIAAADGCSHMSFEHIGWALAQMDRGATRLPALGTMAERVRVSYFLMEDGLKRIVHRYSLLSETHDDDRE